MSGPAEDFREFAASRAAPLHRSAYLLCGDRHLAHDPVQETLTRAYRNWRRVANADNPDAHVRRILINTVRDATRDRKRHPAAAAVPLEDAPEPAIGDESDNVARCAALFQALLTLPFRQRAAAPFAAVKRATTNSTYITTYNDGKQISTIYTGSHRDTRVIDYGKRTWGQSTLRHRLPRPDQRLGSERRPDRSRAATRPRPQRRPTREHRPKPGKERGRHVHIHHHRNPDRRRAGLLPGREQRRTARHLVDQQGHGTTRQDDQPRIRHRHHLPLAGTARPGPGIPVAVAARRLHPAQGRVLINSTQPMWHAAVSRPATSTCPAIMNT